MISVQIIDKDNGLERMDLALKRIGVNVRQTVTALGKQTREVMQEVISVKTGNKRGKSSGNLAKSITLSYWGNKDVLYAGIGSVKVLDEQAPYWRIINYGGQIKSGWVPGFFGSYNKPIAGGAGEQFNYRPYSKGSDEGNSFFMNPKKPIEPTNYIEATKMWLANQIRAVKATDNRAVVK